MDRRARGVLLAGLVLLASVLLPAPAAAAPPEDPEADVVGWEGGYWHNESIQVDQSDGLSDVELDAYVNRTAARIEVLREREFNASVPVEVITREEYGNLTAGNTTEAYRAWNNQVWEALFIVGEDRDVQDVLQQTSTEQTVGAYFFESDEIKIVADGADETTIDRRTLAHELVHAQQDQYHDLTNLTAGAAVQDEQLARNGLVEGEARYLELRYEERCEAEWECVDSLAGSQGSDGDSNLGVTFSLLFPYSDGPPYVQSLVRSGGWEAVEERYGTPPASTEQVIHHTVEQPAPLDVSDEAVGGWSTYPEQGRNGTDTAGEASMFAMMWYQAYEHEAATVPLRPFVETDSRYDLYDYDAAPTAGWGNDAILPYRKEAPSGTLNGYVWVSEWDTEEDAREFRETYVQMLSAHDARRLGPRTLVVDAGPFADAFRVVREGHRVTVVNAPLVSDLDDVRPSVSGATEDPSGTPVDRPVESPIGPGVTANEDGVTPAPPQPGFGPLAALGGLAGWLLLRRRRS